VVLRVPAMIPFHPSARAFSCTRRDLEAQHRQVSYLNLAGFENGFWYHSTREAGWSSVTYFHAIPEQRASVLSATRSPSSKQRAGPVTVATLIFGFDAVGATAAPSARCHSTLSAWRGRQGVSSELARASDQSAK